MKTNILSAIVLTTALLTGRFEKSVAQPVHPAGYWVVETNDRSRDHTLVQFYDLSDQLVYEERLTGVHLDVSRRKTRRLLNQTLRRVVNHTLLGSRLAAGKTPPAPLLAKKRGDTDSW